MTVAPDYRDVVAAQLDLEFIVEWLVNVGRTDDAEVLLKAITMLGKYAQELA